MSERIRCYCSLRPLCSARRARYSTRSIAPWREAASSLSSPFATSTQSSWSRSSTTSRARRSARRRLTDLGMQADFVPSKFNMAALCSDLIGEVNVDGQRFLYPCGDLADAEGPQPLRDAGAIVDTIEAYRTIPDESADADALRRSLAAEEIDAIVFASPSAVQAFFKMIPSQSVSQRVGLVSIGPKTTQSLETAAPGRLTEARQAEVEGLVEAVIRARGLRRAQSSR